MPGRVILSDAEVRKPCAICIDIVPTILEAAGIQAPLVVDGIEQTAPIEGASLVYTFDAKNAKAPSKHKTQYFK